MILYTKKCNLKANYFIEKNSRLFNEKENSKETQNSNSIIFDNNNINSIINEMSVNDNICIEDDLNDYEDIQEDNSDYSSIISHDMMSVYL
jgi:hypothetical protein